MLFVCAMVVVVFGAWSVLLLGAWFGAVPFLLLVPRPLKTRLNLDKILRLTNISQLGINIARLILRF